MSCKDDYNKLQNTLSDLLIRVSETQEKMTKIVHYLKTAKDVTDKSVVLGSSGAPIAFMPTFEANSEVFRIAVQEVSTVLLRACENMSQIEDATEQIAIGVNTQIAIPEAHSVRRTSITTTTLPRVPSPKVTAMTEAVARLSTTLERRKSIT